MKTYTLNIFFLTLILIIMGSSFIFGQAVTSIIVEIRTGDETFAGTDDPIHLFIGGRDLNLDNPNNDDFERNHTDVFEIPIDDLEFNLETIKAVGRIGVIKTGDSYFGGGWLFRGIKIWLNSQNSDPIYANDSINRWLDGDIQERSWHTNLGDAGWNLPQPPPFPPCTVPDIILFAPAISPPPPSSSGKQDTDCDGIPDESDPTQDWDQPDSDGDGLPDVFEGQNGSDPNDNDSDDDSWLDNKNIKDVLMLTKVECLDETGMTNLGSDEIYVISEDVRFPLSSGLDEYWEVDDGTNTEPFIIIDTRVPGTAMPQYKTRIILRDADVPILEYPMDDDILSETLDWGRDVEKVIDHSAGDAHYKLYFRSFTVTFMDQSLIKVDLNGDGILDTDNDKDKDGLTDELEFKISTQDTTVRVPINPVDGYNGLASPLRRESFLEVDAVGSDDKMPFDAKMQVASQFYFNNISMRVDDGYLGGGDILPYRDPVTFIDLQNDYHTKDEIHSPKRRNHYRYALFVPSMEDNIILPEQNGRAARPGKFLMVSRTTMVGSFSAIVLMHEFGHTLSLCHPLNTPEPPSPYPSCPTPPDWDGGDPADCSLPDQCSPEIGCCFGNCDVAKTLCCRQHVKCCRHYCGVGDHDVTAMGSDVGWQELAIGGAIGIMVGLAIIALFIPGIGWIAGAALLLGAAILGAFTGFLFSDSYLRLVNYHAHEWAVIMLDVF